MKAPRISEMAVKRPIATLMFVSIIATLGLVSAFRLPVDLLPEFEMPSVTVFAPYEGVGSLEVESLVLEPMEQAVASVPGLVTMRSTAREGAAIIRLTFSEGTNLLEALGDVRVAVERARGRMPDDLESPRVFRFDPNQFPIIFLSVTSRKDLRDVTRVTRDDLMPRLSRVPGVAAAELRGGFEREVRVELHAERLLALRIPIEDITRALVEENVDVTVGKVRDAGRELGVRTVAGKVKAEELLGIPIAAREGRVVRLEEVASIVDGASESTNVVRVNGLEGVRIGVRKGPGENTVSVAKGVFAELEILREEFPDYELDVIFDQSTFIENAVRGAENAALVGGLLALAVLLLFLRSFRATLLVAIAIPVSVLVAFLVMDRVGVSLNLMTLGGIALGVGMLVDNAVVVLESIVFQRSQGKSPEEAALQGVGEVALAIAASTATTIVIFIPVLFLSGINRVVYGQLALVVATALIASLVVSLTIVPAFAGKLLTRNEDHSSGPFLLRVEAAYEKLLGHIFAAPKSTLVILFGVGLAGLGFWSSIETELMPKTDQGRVQISITLPVGTPLEETDALARQVTSIAHEVVPEANVIYTTVGSPGWWSSRTSEAGSVSVRLPPKNERPRTTDEVTNALRKAMPKVPGARIGVRPTSGMFLLRFLRGGSGEDALEIQIRGQNLDDMSSYAGKMVDALKEIGGVVDPQPPSSRGKPEIAVITDPKKAGLVGLSAERIGKSLETYIRGKRATRLRTAEEEVPVYVRLAQEDRESVHQLKSLLLRPPNSDALVNVGELADLKFQDGPLTISREEGARILTVGAEVQGRPLGEVVKDVRSMLANLEAPKGVRAKVSGEAAATADLFRSLTLGALLAILLVYMVMAAQFESFRQPLLVIFAVPFAGVGVLALFGTKLSTLNLYSFMGMIVLIGVCVNNAIVLIDYARQLREEGMPSHAALKAACLRRLRPILMTTTTTLLGLLPVALNQAEGGELQGPLARVVIAGLFSATAVTLVLIPALYILLEKDGPAPGDSLSVINRDKRKA